MSKIIYLASYEVFHKDFDVIYQDINGKRDLGGDMLDVNLNKFDIVVATPPCNYWSITRGNRCSQYSLDTRHLLPDIIQKLQDTFNGKWIVENVINRKRFKENGIYEICKRHIYEIGRHTYFTNCSFTQDEIDFLKSTQRQDFKYHGQVIKYSDMQNKKHQGGYNVHQVIDYFLKKYSKL